MNSPPVLGSRRRLLRVELLATALAMVAVTGLASCTLLLKSSRDQCSNDGDCTSRGAAFEGTFCSDSNVCENSLDYCKTNRDCITRNGNQPFVCSADHSCKAMLTSLCPKLYQEPDDLLDDNAVIIGAMMFPSNNASTLSADQSIELARQEFKQVGGLPPAVAGGARRPIVILSCDVAPPWLPADLKTAAAHIADVGAVAMIGPNVSDQVTTVSTSVTIPAKLLQFAPGSGSDLVSTLPGRTDVLYRIVSPDHVTIDSLAQYVQQVMEPALRAGKPPVVPAGAAVRVLVLKESTNLGTSRATTLENVLRFNGKSVADNLAGGNYTEVQYGDPNAPSANFQQALGQAVSAGAAFNPDIVIVAGSVLSNAVLLAFEEGLPAANVRPYYALIGGGGLQNDILTRGYSDEGFRKRVIVALGGPAESYLPFATFKLRYQAVFPGFDSLVTTISANTIDSAYLTFYAIAAVGPDLKTPGALGHAVRKVADPRGHKIKDGPTSINDAFNAISSGLTINYNGASGPIVFDANGDNGGFTVFRCFAKDGAPGETTPETGLFIDPTEPTKVQGTNTCF